MLLGCVAAGLVALVGFTSSGAQAMPDATGPTEAETGPVEAAETPAPAPTPEAPPTVPEMIGDAFGADAPDAMAVARCESKLNQDMVGGLGEIGIFQIRPEFHSWRVDEVGGSSLRDAETNVRVARHLQQEQGWWPWTCARRLGIA